ncbi:helix-turn-helix transcriptional regulator [Enterobacter sp.]|uniref:helix-turn-helix transcriptional regulator n=1 Tax=Enterobacter sp. TaxID=42895 RepID=UPI003D096C13
MKTVYQIKTINQLRPLLTGFRKANGLTQKDLAERLGVTQQTYSRLESRPSSASIERLFKVFNVLGVKIALSCESLSTGSGQTEAIHSFDASPARSEQW